MIYLFGHEKYTNWIINDTNINLLKIKKQNKIKNISKNESEDESEDESDLSNSDNNYD